MSGADGDARDAEEARPSPTLTRKEVPTLLRQLSESVTGLFSSLSPRSEKTDSDKSKDKEKGSGSGELERKRRSTSKSLRSSGGRSKPSVDLPALASPLQKSSSPRLIEKIDDSSSQSLEISNFDVLWALGKAPSVFGHPCRRAPACLRLLGQDTCRYFSLYFVIISWWSVVLRVYICRSCHFSISFSANLPVTPGDLFRSRTLLLIFDFSLTSCCP